MNSTAIDGCDCHPPQFHKTRMSEGTKFGRILEDFYCTVSFQTGLSVSYQGHVYLQIVHLCQKLLLFKSPEKGGIMLVKASIYPMIARHDLITDQPDCGWKM